MLSRETVWRPSTVRLELVVRRRRRGRARPEVNMTTPPPPLPLSQSKVKSNSSQRIINQQLLLHSLAQASSFNDDNYDEIFCLESESFPQLIQLIDFSIFCCEMRLTTAVYNKDKSSLNTDNTRRHPDSSHNQHSEKPSSLSELRR